MVVKRPHDQVLTFNVLVVRDLDRPEGVPLDS